MESLKVYILGPSMKTKGGISSVIRVHMDLMRSKVQYQHISTYSGETRFFDFLYFFASIIRVLLICIMRNKKNTLFHIHASTYGSYLRKTILLNVCYIFGFHSIFHMHGADFDEFVDEKGAKKITRTLSRAEKVVLLSDSWLSEINIRMPQLQNLCVLHNPCPQIPDKPIPRIHTKETPIKVIFTGNIGDRKGVFDLIEACSLIKDENFLLEIYGDGQLKRANERIVSKGLQGKIRVLTWAGYDAILQKYAESDVFVLPSYQEGMPMSLLEALSRSLPVISTNIKGIRECIVDGKNGFIIQPGDVEGLANKLKVLIGDGDLRKSMSEASRDIAIAKFTPDVISIGLFNLYGQLLVKLRANASSGAV